VRVLVVNAGSSTLKLRVVDSDDQVTAGTDLHAPSGRFDEEKLGRWLTGAGAVEAVGHRVVHGGERFREPVTVTAEVEEALADLCSLAPIHQPPAVAAMEAVRRARPDLPAVACFDTAFHATLPAAAATYALPAEWRQRWGLRRYGFHGLSHAWASRRAVELAGWEPGGEAATARVVTCHLGAGASLAAVSGGRCVDTTMGFTPLEGLVMATRSGSVDPGLVLWLLEQAGLSAAQVTDGLEHGSGLRGLAGTADMREVVVGVSAGDGAARLAFDVYIRSLSAHVAAMATSLGGLDALVFTGGVGENEAAVRSTVAARLAWMGVDVDPVANESRPNAEITGAGRVRVFVVAAREDLEIARGVRQVLGR
jgi:acetate kinase